MIETLLHRLVSIQWAASYVTYQRSVRLIRGTKN
jgi:hypothetical protein